MCQQLHRAVNESIVYAYDNGILLPSDIQYRAIKAGVIDPVPAYGSARHRATWKASTQRVDPYVEEMMNELYDYFGTQEDVFLNSDDVAPSTFNKEFWDRAFKNKFYGVVFAAMFNVGTGEINSLNEMGANVPGFENTDSLQLAINDILNQTANKVNDTTYEQLIALFQEAAREGESIRLIQDRLAEYFDGRKQDWQTERIARTTMTGASGAADVEAWEQSDVVVGKTWISALIPKRTRPEHANAHGQTVGMNEPFAVGGETLRYPGDPQGSPENIINCLCTQQAEVDF